MAGWVGGWVIQLKVELATMTKIQKINNAFSESLYLLAVVSF